MYTICCQCGMLLAGTEGDGLVSHGLCRRHAREFLESAGLDPALLDEPDFGGDEPASKEPPGRGLATKGIPETYNEREDNASETQQKTTI